MTLAQNAQDPAKPFYDAVIERIVAGGPLPGSSEEPHQALFRALEAMKAEMPVLRAALLAEWSAGEEGLDAERAEEQARHQALIRVVREWREARKERNAIGPDALPRLINAERALAAFPLENDR